MGGVTDGIKLRHTVGILATIVATHTHPPRVISTLRFVEQNENKCIHVYRLAKRIGSMSCPLSTVKFNALIL